MRDPKSNDGKPERGPAQPDYSTGQQIDKVANRQILSTAIKSMDDVAKFTIAYRNKKNRANS